LASASILVSLASSTAYGHLFEHIALSPLGLQVIGSYEGDECEAGDMSIQIETLSHIIKLSSGGGSHNTQHHTFNYSWDAEKSIDITSVTALIINGTCIPINTK